MGFSTGSLPEWIQLIFMLIAGCYALYLFRQSNIDKKNQFVLEILDLLYKDSEIRNIMYAVDTGRNTDQIKFQGDLEKQADKTLKYLDYIGFLIDIGALKKKDLQPFKYEIERILKNRNVKNYINWLNGLEVKLLYLKHLSFK